MTANQREEFNALLDRDAYCADCRAARDDSEVWEARINRLVKTYLHCSGCDADHPACLFSARERERGRRLETKTELGRRPGNNLNPNDSHPEGEEEEGEDPERVCIGREGHMRLCQHGYVPWWAVRAWTNRLLRQEKDSEVFKESHVPVWQCHRDVHKDVVAVRESSSHHHRPSGTPLGWLRSLFSSGSNNAATTGKGQAPQDLNKNNLLDVRADFTKPTCMISAPRYYNTPKLDMIIAWSGHTKLRLGGGGERGRAYTADEVERAVRRAYDQQGRFVCPPVWGPGKGARAGAAICDPCKCDCVEYAGKDMLSWPQPPVEWRKHDNCRVSRRDHGLRVGLRNHSDSMSGRDTHALKVEGQDDHEHSPFRFQCYSQTIVGDTPSQFHQHSDVIECRDADHARRRGSSNGSCAIVSFETRMTIKLQLDSDGRPSLRHMNDAWYWIVDPDSYGITDDAEGFGVYWCKAQTCRNYYRYSRTRLRGLLKTADYVRTCPGLG